MSQTTAPSRRQTRRILIGACRVSEPHPPPFEVRSTREGRLGEAQASAVGAVPWATRLVHINRLPLPRPLAAKEGSVSPRLVSSELPQRRSALPTRTHRTPYCPCWRCFVGRQTLPRGLLRARPRTLDPAVSLPDWPVHAQVTQLPSLKAGQRYSPSVLDLERASNLPSSSLEGEVSARLRVRRGKWTRLWTLPPAVRRKPRHAVPCITTSPASFRDGELALEKLPQLCVVVVVVVGVCCGRQRYQWGVCD